MCLQCRRPRFDPWVGKIPWRTAWPPTPVFLPGESHGQRILEGYSPRCQESDTSEQVTLSNTGNESESEVAQACLTLCNPMDCSPPGTSVHGILQARILEQVAISSFRGSSQPRDQTWVSCIAGRCFTFCATRESHSLIEVHLWGEYCILLILPLKADFLTL